MARTMSKISLILIPLLCMGTSIEAKNWRYWPNIGCYEFSFERTVFFELTNEATRLSTIEGSELPAIVNSTIVPASDNELQLQHILAGSIRNSTTNTPEECIISCNATGFAYAGLQDGKRCVCMNEAPTAKTNGSNCNMGCPGNGSFSCGGSWTMDLHQNPAYHSTNLTYIGCYKNTFNDLDRMLFEGTYNNFRNNTPDWCVAFCTKGNYDYAGLQYGSQCICTNSGPQGTSDAGQCTYGCSGDSSIKMCGGLGYINIFHTDAHKTTIDDWGCGNTVQDIYYQKWYDDMGHCGLTPGGSGGSGSGSGSSGSGSSGSGSGPKSHLMLVGEGGPGSYPNEPVRFVSLSSDNPLPACLDGNKSIINVGFPKRTRPALFPSKDGKPLLCGGWKGDLDKQCIRYDGASDSWTLNSTSKFGGENQVWDFHPDVGLIVAGEYTYGQQSLQSKKVDLSTDYGQTKTTIAEYPRSAAKFWSNGCMVIVNTTTVFFAGGLSGEGQGLALNDTYYLNIDTKQWTQGPDLTLARSYLTCSLITKPFPQIVIVDGYADRPNQAGNKRVDILNLQTNELTKGQDIPTQGKGVYGHSEVVNDNKVLIFGGHNGGGLDHPLDVYEYDGQAWTTLEAKLPSFLYRGSAIFVDSMDICT